MYTNPRIYPVITDDFRFPAAEWEPVISPMVRYVAVADESGFLGILIFGLHSAIQYEIHNLLLPHVGWKRRVATGYAMWEWLWKSGSCQRVIGKVIESNRYTLRFNEVIGMKVFGRNEKAVLQSGRLQDEIWFGISRPEAI